MQERILLLHGALGSAKQFAELTELLSADYAVLSLDFDGHGGKPMVPEFSIELFSRNVIDYLDAREISMTDVFGYSMGGYVALNLARKFPERIGKIATLGTKLNWNPESAEAEVRMLDPEKIEQKVPQFVARLGELHAPQNWKDIVRATARMLTEMGAGKCLSDSDFEVINNVVVLGLGSLDNMVTADETSYVANLLPNGDTCVLEGARHPIEQVDPLQIAGFMRYALNFV